jgi:acetyl esterase/lipase
MARMDLRVRAWGALTRRQASVASRSEEDVIALQRRGMPENRMTDLLFGKVAPGVAVDDRRIPGPEADIPVRVYTPAGALIQVAQHDPLKDDGMRYAAALRAAAVPVRVTEYVGMPHGFMNFPGLCRGAPQALSELCAEQKAALA